MHLIDPIDVEDMHNLMERSYLVLTDSGGLQEEAPSCGVPVLVLRDKTERQEAVDAGSFLMAGTRKDDIVRLTRVLLDDQGQYQRMSRAVNPYGDGRASERIIQAILQYFEG